MFIRKKSVSAIAQLFGVAFVASHSALALAQQEQKLEKVEITGSSIKRSIASEGALPITVISVKELREAGVTTTEELVGRVASSQSSLGTSQSIGSATGGVSNANLRGLGANKTLVLLNGRRLAAFAFDSATVDLNAIPFAAIERVEILRDGASAIYGTDAIGGVINFITKNNYNGIEVSGEYQRPQQSGGVSKRATLSGGIGNLDTDKFNLWATFDYRKQDAVAATQRDFARTGVIPDRGIFLTSGTTFPGNFSQTSTSLTGNPTVLNAEKCAPPFSLYLPESFGTKTCRYDYTAAIDIIPPTEQTTFATRGTFNLSDTAQFSLEYVRATNNNTARVAEDPVTGIVMTPNSPYYPKTYPGIDATKNITVGWRMIPAGRRTNESESTAQRVVADLKGVIGAWDYRTGLYWTESRVQDGATDGYVNAALIKAGVLNGTLNPFGPADEAQLKLINDAKIRGTFAKGVGSTLGYDARISRELFKMGGGAAGVSLGLDLRREKYKNDTVDENVNAAPSAGRSPSHTAGDRNVAAITGEMLLPFTDTLEMQLAARYDRYSDFGGTFNPKVGFRWQPAKSVVVRGSYNTGFRAPSLDDLYGPQVLTFTANSYDDPILCPGGVVAPGGIEARDCGQQTQRLVGGNTALKPEKSKTFSLGVAFEPIKDLTVSADYFNIKLTKQISGFPEQAIYEDPVKYASRFVRCNQLSPNVQDNYAGCQADYANGKGIAYILALTDNLGSVKTNGLDFNADYALNAGDLGRFNFSWSGTWVHKYLYQRSEADPFVENVGAYVDSSPVFRWQHVLGVSWKRGPFAAQWNTRYKTGYRDANTSVEPEFFNRVGSYALHDVSFTYTGVKNLTLTAGIKNLLNTKPPFSNQETVFQKGYDPRYTDALGRTWTLRASYNFK